MSHGAFLGLPATLQPAHFSSCSHLGLSLERGEPSLLPGQPVPARTNHRDGVEIATEGGFPIVYLQPWGQACVPCSSLEDPAMQLGLLALQLCDAAGTSLCINLPFGPSSSRELPRSGITGHRAGTSFRLPMDAAKWLCRRCRPPASQGLGHFLCS